MTCRFEKSDSLESMPCNSLLALRIRNLIAAREFNTAAANREQAIGGWLSDHAQLDYIMAVEINSLLDKASNGTT